MRPYVPLTHRLQNSAAQRPEAEALVHGARRVVYADLWRQVCAVAGYLRQAGIAPGDRVAVVLENSPEYVAVYYGALAAGAIAVGMNASARVRELSSWLTHCDARALFVDARHPDLQQLREGAASATRVVVVDHTGKRGEWLEVLEAPPALPTTPSADDAAAILYTSGTTGRPKGVTLTHGNLSENAASIIEYLGLQPSDKVLNLLPFFYSYGSSVLHTHLAVGATLVVENHLVYPQRILARMADERVTGFPGVPSTFALLLQGGDFSRFDLTALRYLTQAGGAMPTPTVRRLCEALPQARLFVMYGQTEATARLTYLPPDRLGDKLGSVGIPIPGVEIVVSDDDDRPAAPEVVGEVCVRGGNVMKGYFRDEEATRAVLRNGWLHTGDLGYLDTDGYLYLQGRRSDIIKSGAHRISPLDIEDVIVALPEVAEAAVVGVPDDVLGEAIKAVITLKPGATLDAMQVQRHCSEQLPRYKVPRTIEFASSLPRTSSGKIMRYQLTGAGSSL
jgi:acyl-CoA synthetase (AMP-forming)/AMP-acid ligase II